MGYSNYIGIPSDKEAKCLQLIGIRGFIEPQDQYKVMANYLKINQILDDKKNEDPPKNSDKKKNKAENALLQEIIMDFKNFITRKRDALFDEFAKKTYQQRSLTWVLTYENSDDLIKKFIDFLDEKSKEESLPENFKEYLIAEFDTTLGTFNKRYRFSDNLLIRLMETALRKNIRFLEGLSRYREDAYLDITKTGEATLDSDKKETQFSFLGDDIPQRPDNNQNSNSSSNQNNSDSEDKKELKNPDYYVGPKVLKDALYLMGRSGTVIASDYLTGAARSDEMMKNFVRTVIETVELCYAIFEENYEDKPLKAGFSSRTSDKVVERIVLGAKRNNLPHLLGIPRFADLPEEVQNVLSEGVRPRDDVGPGYMDSALRTLDLLLAKKDFIISNNGLMPIMKEGKEQVLTMFPWEKMMLRTNAFLRSDMFKNCLCVALLSKPLIPHTNESFMTITPTDFSDPSVVRYVGGETDFSGIPDISKIPNTGEGMVDFVFRGLTPNTDSTGNITSGLLFSDTLLVGKKENITPKGVGYPLRFLNYFRHRIARQDPSGRENMNPKLYYKDRNFGLRSPRFFTGNPEHLTPRLLTEYLETTFGVGSRKTYRGFTNVPIAVIEFIESGDYIHVFSIEEQMLTALSVKRGLGIPVGVSDDVIYCMEAAYRSGAPISKTEIDEFKNNNVKGNIFGVSKALDSDKKKKELEEMKKDLESKKDAPNKGLDDDKPKTL